MKRRKYCFTNKEVSKYTYTQASDKNKLQKVNDAIYIQTHIH